LAISRSTFSSSSIDHISSDVKTFDSGNKNGVLILSEEKSPQGIVKNRLTMEETLSRMAKWSGHLSNPPVVTICTAKHFIVGGELWDSPACSVRFLIGNLKLENRVVMPPLETNYASADGFVIITSC